MPAGDEFQKNLLNLQSKVQERAKIDAAKMERLTQEGIIAAGANFMDKFREEQQAAAEAKATQSQQGQQGPVRGIVQPVNQQQLQAGAVGNQGLVAPQAVAQNAPQPAAVSPGGETPAASAIDLLSGGQAERNANLSAGTDETVTRIRELAGQQAQVPNTQQVPEPSGFVKAFFEKQLIGATGRERALANNSVAAGNELARLQVQQAPLEMQLRLLNGFTNAQEAITRSGIASIASQKANLDNQEQRLDILKKAGDQILERFGQMPPSLIPMATDALVSSDLQASYDLLTEAGAGPIMDDLYKTSLQMTFTEGAQKDADLDKVLQDIAVTEERRGVELGLAETKLATDRITLTERGAALPGKLDEVTVANRQAGMRKDNSMGRLPADGLVAKRKDKFLKELTTGIPLTFETGTVLGDDFFDTEAKATTMDTNRINIEVEYLNRWGSHDEGLYTVVVPSAPTSSFDSGFRPKRFDRTRTIEAARTMRIASAAMDPSAIILATENGALEGESADAFNARINSMILKELVNVGGAEVATDMNFLESNQLNPLLFASEFLGERALTEAVDNLREPNGGAVMFILHDVDAQLDKDAGLVALTSQARETATVERKAKREADRRAGQSRIGRAGRAPGF